jgi:hypothetical protein
LNRWKKAEKHEEKDFFEIRKHLQHQVNKGELKTRFKSLSGTIFILYKTLFNSRSCTFSFYEYILCTFDTKNFIKSSLRFFFVNEMGTKWEWNAHSTWNERRWLFAIIYSSLNLRARFMMQEHAIGALGTSQKRFNYSYEDLEWNCSQLLPPQSRGDFLSIQKLSMRSKAFNIIFQPCTNQILFHTVKQKIKLAHIAAYFQNP